MININANLVKEAEFSEFEKDGYPPSYYWYYRKFYPNSDYYGVGLWDTDGNPEDVVTYETNELELF